MKKFLSFILAFVMSLSLLVFGASALEQNYATLPNGQIVHIADNAFAGRTFTDDEVILETGNGNTNIPMPIGTSTLFSMSLTSLRSGNYLGNAISKVLHPK